MSVFAVLLGFLFLSLSPTPSSTDLTTSDCKKYGESGECLEFEGISIVSNPVNSIIDASNVFTDVDENTDISLGSEKMVMVTKSVLLDSNQKIVSNSTQKIDFSPATLLDLQKNILDLGSVQLSFDLLYKKNANVVIDGEVEVLLDGQSKGKRYLSYSGQLPTNLIRLNVDKESRLLAERTHSLTFTLADEGKDWVDGSIHDLKIVLNKLDGQVISNGQVQNFEYGKDLILYRLEMTVDQTKQVSFDEDHNAISVFKADGVLQVCGSKTFYPSGNPTNTNLGWQGNKSPNVKVFHDGKELVDIKPSYDCNVFSQLPRNSEIILIVTDQKILDPYSSILVPLPSETFKIITPVTKSSYHIQCYHAYISNGDFDRWCNSNIGFSRSVEKGTSYGLP